MLGPDRLKSSRLATLWRDTTRRECLPQPCRMKDQTTGSKAGSKERSEVQQDLEKLSLLGTEEDDKQRNGTGKPTPTLSPAIPNLRLAGETWPGTVAPNLLCLIGRC